MGPTDKKGEKIKQLFEKIPSGEKPITIGVVCPETKESLLSALIGAERGCFRPVLIGSRKHIQAIADAEKQSLDSVEIIHCEDESEAAKVAVRLTREKVLDTLMKGSLHTDTLMKEVVHRDHGLRTNRRISHVMLVDVPVYHKLLIYTDAAFNILPTLPEKKDIVQNAIDFALSLNIVEPKVALLSAIEEITDKMPSTIDCAKLCEMAQRGEIQGGLLDGPLSFDLAISAHSAEAKKRASPVCQNADILMFPNIEAANIAVKQAVYFSHAATIGIAFGATVPLIILSRTAGIESRIGSCQLARFYVHYKNNL